MNRWVLRVLVFLSAPLAAQEFRTDQETLRVGGVYVLKSVENQDQGFRITFESETKTGKFDTLVLESDHVHHAIKEGQSVRISAEVMKSQQTRAEVAQVLLFLPHSQGVTPVWMLSRKYPSRDLNGARYIEMHAPQSDYAVF